MAKPTNQLEDLLICGIGFLIGAIAAAELTGTPAPSPIEHLRIDRLLEDADPAARQDRAHNLLAYPERELLK